MLERAQADLGVTLPKQYLEYLSECGHGGIGGIEVLGVGLDGSAIFEDVTLGYRSEGLPKGLVAIERCDEWLECIDCKTGEVVSWSPYDSDGTMVDFPDFDTYLLGRFEDAVENL